MKRLDDVYIDTFSIFIIVYQNIAKCTALPVSYTIKLNSLTIVKQNYDWNILDISNSSRGVRNTGLQD